MTEEEKILNVDSDRKEHEMDQEAEIIRNRPKLDHQVLFSVLIGIVAVFILMMFINGVIAAITTEVKTAYYLSIMASNCLFILLIFLIKKPKRLTWHELGWKTVKAKSVLKDILIIWGITWLVHIVYMLIIYSFGIMPPENELVRLLEKPTLLVLLANIMLIAVVAPMVEETLFRGLLFGSMRTYMGLWTAIVVSAAIFSALHFELIGFVPRFVLGIGLGYLFVKHDSIYPSIGLHALNNLLAVVMISSFS